MGESLRDETQVDPVFWDCVELHQKLIQIRELAETLSVWRNTRLGASMADLIAMELKEVASRSEAISLKIRDIRKEK